MKALWAAIRFSLLDMRGASGRFGLIIACLAVGTMLIAAVNGVGASMENALARNAAVLMGGDIEASRTDRPANEHEMELLGRLGSVASVVDTNVRGHGDGQDVFVDLIAISEAYPLLANIESPQLPENLAPADFLAESDGGFGVLVDPQMLDALAAAVGDTVEIGGSPFVVRGTITRLPDALVRGFRLGVPAVITLEALRALGDPTSPLPGLGTTFRYKLLLASGDAEETARALEAELDDAGWTVRTARDGLGPMVRYYDLFMRFLLIVGLASLLIGGLAVWNGVSAYMDQRSQTVAILRSLGARRGRVFLHFMVQVALLALAAVGAGLAAGLAIALIALPIVSVALGLELAPVADPRTLFVVPLIGLVTTFMFAFLPLAQAQSVQPALLFRSRGLGVPPINWRTLLGSGQGGALILGAGIFIWLATILTGDLKLVLAFAAAGLASVLALRLALLVGRRILRTLPDASNRLFRRALHGIASPGANASVLVVSLGIVVSVLVVVLVLQVNLRNEYLGASVFDAPSFVASDLFEDELEVLEEMAAGGEISRLAAMPMLRGAVTAINGVPATGLRPSGPEASFLMSGNVPLSYAAEMPVNSQLIAGSWWPTAHAGSPLVSLHESLRQGLGVALGDEITFEIFGEQITAEVANFRSYAWQGGIDVLATFSPGAIDAFPTTLFVAVTAPAGEEAELESRLSQELPFISFIGVGETLTKITTALGQLSLAAALVGGLAVGNGLLVFAGSLAVGREQREADALIARVLGERRGQVLAVSFIYHALLAAYATVLAVALGIGFAALLTRLMLEVQFALEPPTLSIVAGLAIIGTGLLGSLSLRKAFAPRPALYLRELGVE